jgi:hypothetical protein
MSKIIHLTSGEVTLQINKGCYAKLGGVNHAFPGKRGLSEYGTKDDPDRQVYHAAHDPWKADKVYSGERPADQESRRARKEPSGDRRVDRRHGWFPASHLLKVGDQFAAARRTKFCYP